MYLWIKALHIISVITWMAGLFYLPRLFVYHTRVTENQDQSDLFKVMERKLLKIIMNPSMVIAALTGFWLMYKSNALIFGWMHGKLLFLVILFSFHGFLAKCQRSFEQDQNQKSEKFYRLINEIPTICLLGIVIMVVVKPF